MRADLHSHSTASDGVQSPAENVKLAKMAGLSAMAVTDHDTVDGVAEALKEGQRQGIEVIPGIEISTVNKGQDIHVLGYFIDIHNESFLNKLMDLRRVRDKRNEMIIERLQQLNIPITVEEVYAKKTGDRKNIGRPHIAEVLMDKGYVESMEEAFELYLGKEGKAYANPPRITPFEAFEIIRQAGGVPVLAHPGLYRDDEMVLDLITKHGLQAIEVYHPDHNEDQEAHYGKMADTYGLLKTAGSDFHGARNGHIFHAPIGTKTIHLSVIHQLHELASRQR